MSFGRKMMMKCTISALARSILPRRAFNAMTACLAAMSGVLSAVPAHAQTFPNPVFAQVYAQMPLSQQCVNPGFEAGFADWTGFRGKRTLGLPYETKIALPGGSVVSNSCSPAAGIGNTGAGNTCVIPEASGIDGNLGGSSHPMVVQGGQSMRLGGNAMTAGKSNGNAIEGVARRFVVQASNAIYRFRFSSVMDRAHDNTAAFTGEEPYFQATAIDPATGTVIDSITMPASGFNPSLVASPANPAIVYSLWSCAQLDLSSHVGKEVAVFFTNSDCTHGGHTAYTYVDDTCATCDKPEDTGITIDQIGPDLAICTPDRVANVTGTISIPAAQQTSNIKVTLEVRQGGATIATLTNGTLTGNTYNFAIGANDLSGIGCYDLIAILEYDVQTPSGTVVHVRRETAAEGRKPGADNDLCLKDCPKDPPDEASCLTGKPEIACGKVPGTYVVTLNVNGTGGIVPTTVAIAPKTASITILNPQAAYQVINGQVKFTVAGANPGDSLSFGLEGTRVGAGAVEGSDLCCNGTIKVEIPKDLPCEKSTVDVTKVCEPARYGKYAAGQAVTAAGFLSVCHITVKTTGPQAGTLTVTDQLGGGGTLVSASSTTSPPWTCGPTGCAINGAQLNQTASTSVIDVNVAFPSKGHVLEAKNCALLAVAGKPADKDCATFTVVDDPKDPDVAIVKVCEPARQMDSPDLQFGARCTITVTTTGPIQTHLVVSDTLTGNGQVTSFANTSAPAWICIPGQCDMDGSNLDQTSSVSTFDAFVTFPPGQGAGQATAKNCARLGLDAHPAGESCADIKAGDDKFKLDVKKDCSGVIALSVNGPWAGSCKITVTATGGPRPQFIAISDVISDANANRTPPIAMTNMVSADPWACATPSGAGGPLDCTIAGTAFPANGSSTLDIDVYVPVGVRAGEARNCVKAAGASDALTLAPSSPPVSTDQVCVPLPGGKDTPPPPADGTLTVTKVCDPAVPTGTSNDWGGQSLPTVQSTCHVTVQGSGNLPPVIEIHENLVSGAPAANSPMQINIAGMTSAQNWQFPLFPVAQGTANGSVSTPALATISSADLIAAGGTSTLDVTVQFMNDGWVTETGNCVQAFGVATPGSAPGAQSQKVCVPFTGGNTVIAGITVNKRVVSSAPDVLPSIAYPLSASCDASVAAINDGQTITIGNLAAGTACTITEGPLDQGIANAAALDACGGAGTPVWTTSYAPSQTVMAGPGAHVTITNTLGCERKPIDGGLVAAKTLAGPCSLDAASQQYMCLFNIQVSNTGTADYNGPFAMTDVLSDPAPSGASVSLTSIAPYGMNMNAVPNGMSYNNGAITVPAGGAITGTILVSVPVQAGAQVFENCLRVDQPAGVAPSCASANLPADNSGLACDPATAAGAGDLCRCRFDNMSPVSTTACRCKDGFTLKAGQGCVRDVAEPKCDPATAVAKGEACVCRFKSMVRKSATACACAKGLDLVAGKGCVKAEPACGKGERFQPKRNRCEPVCAKGFDYSVKRNACVKTQPDCRKGTVFNAKSGKCVPVQPVCRKPFVYDPKRNACVEQVVKCKSGQVAVKGKCVGVPKCPPGTIPVPGTKACVTIGIGGGGRDGGGRGNCKP
ncbi:MAG: hypothetical protein WAT70_13825, partial [Rhizobiaceae bacterium]